MPIIYVLSVIFDLNTTIKALCANYKNNKMQIRN